MIDEIRSPEEIMAEYDDWHELAQSDGWKRMIALMKDEYEDCRVQLMENLPAEDSVIIAKCQAASCATKKWYQMPEKRMKELEQELVVSKLEVTHGE